MTSDSPQMMAAAIDIGSNSIKMTIGRANTEGGVDQLDWASEVVRLGQVWIEPDSWTRSASKRPSRR